jgi:uncharacterized protein (TIGR02453 family)
MSDFPGFPKQMTTFFRGLVRNNNREWFLAHKQDYEDYVKGPMLALVEAINAELEKAMPRYVTESKRAVYRIYRDTRFSKDKTPYKDHAGALFSPRNAPKHGCAALYCGVSHDSVEVAAGVYMPGPDQLLQIRTLLSERSLEFRRIAESKSYLRLMGELRGEQLQRCPKGFPPNHPAEDLLRRKAWYFYKELDPAIATTSRLFKEIQQRFLASAPLVEFLNGPILEAERKKERAARMLGR